jgi:quercetin dioxygenase-like cupin family protein
MKTWDVTTLDGFPGPPQILSTTDETRAIALGLAAGQTLAEHEVHERAWIVVIAGDVELSDTSGDVVTAAPGVVFELEAHERHSVRASSDARLLLLLAPWPGEGHPGTMTLEEKAHAQEHAADHAAALARDAAAADGS